MLKKVRMTVLASGSRGNSAVISAAGTSILVDAGLSCRELLRRMVVAGEEPERLNAILITHEHLDHVAGLAVLARKLQHSGVLYRANPQGLGAHAAAPDHDDVCQVAGACAARKGGKGGGSIRSSRSCP